MNDPTRATIDISTPQSIKKALRAHYKLGYDEGVQEKKGYGDRRAGYLWEQLIDPIIGQFFIPPRELEIVKCRYVLGMTLEEVGKRYGITRERVRQVEGKALQRVKDIHRSWQEAGRKELMVELASKPSIDSHVQAVYATERKKEIYTPIEILNFSPRTLNALINAGVGSVEQLCRCTVSDIWNFRGFGQKALDEVTAALYSRGLSLASEKEEPLLIDEKFFQYQFYPETISALGRARLNTLEAVLQCSFDDLCRLIGENKARDVRDKIHHYGKWNLRNPSPSKNL